MTCPRAFHGHKISAKAKSGKNLPRGEGFLIEPRMIGSGPQD